MSSKRRTSGAASSNKQRSPFHFSLAASGLESLCGKMSELGPKATKKKKQCEKKYEAKKKGKQLAQGIDLPSPVDLVVGAHEAVAGIVDNEQLVRFGVLEK